METVKWVHASALVAKARGAIHHSVKYGERDTDFGIPRSDSTANGRVEEFVMLKWVLADDMVVVKENGRGQIWIGCRMITDCRQWIHHCVALAINEK
jgi:hypothetical protein